MGRAARGGLKGVLISGLVVGLASAASVGLNTDLRSPPRFDGAGYAVLGEALASGRGYARSTIPSRRRMPTFRPDTRPRWRVLWRPTGRSVAAAHVFSAACTVAAILRPGAGSGRSIRRGAALILGLALALNWTWGRGGGAIQSEPLYMLWELLAVLAAVWAGRRGGVGAGIVLGARPGRVRPDPACRGLPRRGDRPRPAAWQRRPATALAAVLTVAVLVLPWVVWLASVRHNTQVGLLRPGGWPPGRRPGARSTSSDSPTS